MAYLKPIDGKYAQKGAIPTLTLGTFVHAASVANLLVATLVFIEFSVMSLVNRDGRDFQMGLWLVPFVTMVIWGTATVMCVVALLPRWLCTLGRRLIGGRARSSPSKFGCMGRLAGQPEAARSMTVRGQSVLSVDVVPTHYAFGSGLQCPCLSFSYFFARKSR